MKRLIYIILFSLQLIYAQATNGLQNIGMNIGLGGSLTQNTNIGLGTYSYTLKNDSSQFILGNATLYGLQFPFYGITYNKGYFGRLDLRTVGSTDQFTVAFIDSARQSSNGLNVRKEQFSLSVYDNINIPARYEYGFTGYNTNADHFCFDRTTGIDVTLLKAHKDYARIQHYYYDAANLHYAEVFINDKIYLKTDADTALIAEPNGDIILPGKGTGLPYFNNSTLTTTKNITGSVLQTGAITNAVTINNSVGTIKTVSTNMVAGASAIFTVNNNLVNNVSLIICTVKSSSTGTPYVIITGQTNGSFNIKITNVHPVQSLNSNLSINYIIL